MSKTIKELLEQVFSEADAGTVPVTKSGRAKGYLGGSDDPSGEAQARNRQQELQSTDAKPKKPMINRPTSFGASAKAPGEQHQGIQIVEPMAAAIEKIKTEKPAPATTSSSSSDGRMTADQRRAARSGSGNRSADGPGIIDRISDGLSNLFGPQGPGGAQGRNRGPARQIRGGSAPQLQPVTNAAQAQDGPGSGALNPPRPNTSAPRDDRTAGEAEAKANLNKMQQDYKADKSLINKANPIADVGTKTSNLRMGSRGDDVKALQRSLGIKDDGIFGPNTAAALKSFQQKQGLKVDSIAGDQTMSAIKRMEAQRKLKSANTTNSMVASTLGENLLKAFDDVVSSKHSNIFQEAKKKKLHPNQKQLDKNNNGELDSEDFRMLRNEEDTSKDYTTGVGKPEYSKEKPHYAYPNEHGATRGKKDDRENSSKHKKNSPLPARGKMITASYNKEEFEQIDEAEMMNIDVGEKVRLTNPKAPARHTVLKIKGQNVHIKKDSGEEIVMPLNRIKKVKYKAMKEEVESIFSEEELAYFEAVGKPDADYVGNAGVNTASRTGTLSDEYVEEGRRGRPPKGESMGANELHMNAKRAADNMDNVMHTFANGQKIRMTKAMGTGFMARHRAAKTPDAKDALLNHAHSSASAFKNVVEGKPVPAMKQKGVSLAGKNYGDKS